MKKPIINPKWETWDQLRTFGNSRLVQSTVVVPILGYVILFNANLAEYFNLIFDSDDSTALPGRLYWLYYGFCLVAAGSIVFSLKCPAEVKHHGAAYDFVYKQQPIMHPARDAAMKEKLLFDYYSTNYGDSGFDYVTAADSDVDAVDIDEELRRIRLNMRDARLQIGALPFSESMRDYFEILEESRPTWRRITFLCYFIGIATLSVPSIHTFILVAKSLIDPLIGH